MSSQNTFEKSGLGSPLPIVADVHLHTSHSHGRNSIEEMYQACKNKGLKIIGFSEHSPRPKGYSYPSDYQEKLQQSFPLYVEEVRKAARSALKKGVRVLLGIEVDYISGQEDYAETLSKAYPFDYIIGGLHFQADWGFDFSPDDWAGKSLDERFSIYQHYYKDMIRLCQTGLFHIVAHPDLIKIFSLETFNQWLNTPQALPLIKKALGVMKEKGMVMEISSAGLRKPCKEIYPGPRIMELAGNMQLPVSFASDAHCVNTPAHAFDELARYAANFGYSESCVVVQGEVQRVPFSKAPIL